MRSSIAVCLFLVLFGGCAQAPVHPVALTDNHLANATSLVSSVRTDVAANPQPSPAIITSETARLDTAKTELSQAATDNQQRNIREAKQADDLVKAQTTIKAYQQRWVGDKTFQFFRRILAIASIVLVLGIGLKVWGILGTGGLSLIAGKAGGLVLHGFPWLGAGIIGLLGRLKGTPASA